MLAAARNRTQLHVSIALLSGAALLVWLVVHNSGGDSTSPPYKVTAAFMALHEQACKPAGARAGGAAGQSKVAAYEWEVAQRLQHLKEHEATVSMIDMWDLMAPLWNCDGPLERVGWFLDGGKWMCDANRTLAQEPCIVLSMGSNGQTDFETAILQRAPHCRVHTYDHTLHPAVQAAVASIPGVEFHSMGLTGEANLEAMRRGEVKWDPYTADNFTTMRAAIEAADTAWVDVLKIDIEGYEWPIFHELLVSNTTIPITQILIELHPWQLANFKDLYPGSTVHSVGTFFEGMRRHGYRVFANEPNMHSGDAVNFIEYSFVKVDQWGQTVDRRSFKHKEAH